jgi:GT2 family glycosyltransferase
MILSVVIVNFNVKYFLEQCLCSLKKAVDRSALLSEKTEVWVVDNASSDGSVAFLQPLYPAFHFIQNTENTGFGRANNLALPRCTGEFILFLNPDTVLAEDSLDACISFFQEHPDAGAVGVRMIDGSGNFLKESKRGFPGPRTSFFKTSGLTRAFPKSPFFAAYYSGELDAHQNHQVEILSGACMMVRKTVLDKTGGFDEQFFMYAEDIDLSYRIQQAGFRNYYLGSVRIVHFKGESASRDARYIKQFHLAMTQFMRKYFRGSFSSGMLFFLRLGIALKQQIGLLRLSFKKEPGQSSWKGPVFIKGDPQDLSAVLTALQKSGIRVAETESGAGSILFCAGEQKTLQSIIREMDESERKFCCYIHSSGTHAIVGGSSGKKKGGTISWS